ncbi:MAG: rhodanese-like domain-containing protein [Verrucomicrobiales bacterium]
MKLIASLCSALLLLLPAFAEEPATCVELKAPQAIELVAQHAGTAKTGPKKPALTIIDVRTPEEYSKGCLANSVNIDFRGKDFKEALAKLDKSTPCLVHCAVGGRSAKTRDLMKSLGFKTIYHLEGGIKAWEKAGGPLTAPAKP